MWSRICSILRIEQVDKTATGLRNTFSLLSDNAVLPAFPLMSLIRCPERMLADLRQ